MSFFSGALRNLGIFHYFSLAGMMSTTTLPEFSWVWSWLGRQRRQRPDLPSAKAGDDMNSQLEEDLKYSNNVIFLGYSCLIILIILIIFSFSKITVNNHAQDQWDTIKGQALKNRFAAANHPDEHDLFSMGELSHQMIANDWFGYGSIPIHTIFNGMNIHLSAILMWTTGEQGFDTLPYIQKSQ